jgi:uncharacterized protein YdaU (DUF1376 family)
MSVKTYMPLVIGDYLKDTSRLTCEEHGAYLLLLMDYWVNGPLPDRDKALASICRLSMRRWAVVRGSVQQFFRVADGRWFNKRAEEELEKAKHKSNQARVGANARWAHENRKADASETHGHPQCSASASSEDSESNPSPPSSTTPAPRQRGSGREPAGALPMDWTPDQANLDLAIGMGLTVPETERTMLKFRAYWTTGRGAGTRRTPKGWNTTWANWISKEADNVGTRTRQPVAAQRPARNQGHDDPDVRRSDFEAIIAASGGKLSGLGRTDPGV